jgi:hypothetical protein
VIVALNRETLETPLISPQPPPSERPQAGYRSVLRGRLSRFDSFAILCSNLLSAARGKPRYPSTSLTS